MSKTKRKTKIDYKHYVCAGITLLSLVFLAFYFPRSVIRLLESLRDVGTSLAFYFCELFGIDHSITPTVNDLPFKLPSKTTGLAKDFSGFQADWNRYWRTLVSEENLLEYAAFVLNAVYYVCWFAAIGIVYYILLKKLLHRRLTKWNNDTEKDTKSLRIFKKIEKLTYLPIKRWIIAFIGFVQENRGWFSAWLFIWGVSFNVFTILLEFFAFYFYFCAKFSMKYLYRQVYKLVLDITPALFFIPLWVWIIVGIWYLQHLCHKYGYAVLYHCERMNRGFLKERGLVTVIDGDPGTGKTRLATDMALSADVEMRDKALEVILECDLTFPNMTWKRLAKEMQQAAYFHKIYDVWSVKRWVRRKYRKFCKGPCRERIFGYDYERYGVTYDDNLTLTSVWEVIQDYACAYFIYTVQCNYILSNYSIRTDTLVADLGNFPLYNNDFFRRDSRLIDSFSRHSHVLDFDMLRLGKIMLENNPNRNALGFGVYVITEIDKELKNTPSLKEVKAESDECNQKNDLFIPMAKMIRHACVIRNRVFVRIIADLQRAPSLGADFRELGELIHIVESSGSRPTLPFFSPFWVFEWLYLKLKDKLEGPYLETLNARGDNSLVVYLLKNLMAKMKNRYDKTCNLFGREVLQVEVEHGRMDGKSKRKKYFRMSKKMASRYGTDCLSGLFEVRGEMNTMGIMDFAEYADKYARNDELLKQHSHFQKEVYGYSKKAS